MYSMLDIPVTQRLFPKFLSKNPPKYLIVFDEPDVESQANMDPYYSADLYMQQTNLGPAKPLN
jgi:hypothetical protein